MIGRRHAPAIAEALELPARCMPARETVRRLLRVPGATLCSASMAAEPPLDDVPASVHIDANEDGVEIVFVVPGGWYSVWMPFDSGEEPPS